MTNYYTAICFFHFSENKQPWKYRNIKNKENFIKFAAKHGVLYVNFYSKNTREFAGREWIRK